MFNGQESITFRTNESYDRVLKKVEDCLGDLGEVYFEDDGEFEVQMKPVCSGMMDVKLTGSLEERKTGKYSVKTSYTLSPNTTGIILVVVLAVVFLPLALIGFFLATNAQSDVKRRLQSALRDVEDDFESDDE